MVLSVAGLVYRRRPRHAPLLAGIDLELRAGAILCLLGPNGSGKTTLLRCLIGALQPERGSIRIDGQASHSVRTLARVLAYVPQTAADSALTLLDVVLLGRTPHLQPLALPGRRDVELAREALEAVGIGNLAGRSFSQVSGGERQLALIARALAQRPRLLVMDEPMASLDLGNQGRVMRTLQQLAARRIAVLITSHQPEHALRLGSQVALLAGGRIRAAGPARAVLSAAALSALYGADVEVVEQHGSPVACIARI